MKKSILAIMVVAMMSAGAWASWYAGNRSSNEVQVEKETTVTRVKAKRPVATRTVVRVESRPVVVREERRYVEEECDDHEPRGRAWGWHRKHHHRHYDCGYDDCRYDDRPHRHHDGQVVFNMVVSK